MPTATLLLLLAQPAMPQVTAGSKPCAADDPAGTAAEFACLDALWQETFREWQAADIDVSLGKRPRDRALVHPTLDLLPFFASLAERGEGRAVLWLLSAGLYGAVHPGADPRAAAAELVEQHADEDWIKGLAPVMGEPALARLLLERTRNPAVAGATLVAMAEDAYSGSIQDDREAEYVAARAAEGERLYCELLTRFPEGIREFEALPWRSVESWRVHLFELEHLQVGHAAPALEARNPEGVEVRLADSRGKVVVICFLESSAADSDLAALGPLALRKDTPLQVLALDRTGRVAEPPAAAGWTLLRPKGRGERRSPCLWDVGILPNIVLDARGTIRFRGHGQRLLQIVEALVAEVRAGESLPAEGGQDG